MTLVTAALVAGTASAAPESTSIFTSSPLLKRYPMGPVSRYTVASALLREIIEERSRPAQSEWNEEYVRNLAQDLYKKYLDEGGLEARLLLSAEATESQGKFRYASGTDLIDCTITLTATGWRSDCVYAGPNPDWVPPQK